MTITIIRIDGTEEQHEVARPDDAFRATAQLIHARTVEMVNLRDGRVMLVDEDGYEVQVVEREPPPGYDFAAERVPVRPLKPANPKATALYHAICVEGTTHQIVGDVAIVNDADFAE
jgi:hypothetical protein